MLAVVLMLAPGMALAQNASMSDDFQRIMEWLTGQTAKGLGFNAGSTFDPPNEMRPWRMQPDVSIGLGMFPYDKGVFPQIQVEALAEKDPVAMLPDKVMIPNLTVHMRLGLPWRMDLGVRGANMTTPSNYKLSETTTGNGQSNTMGVGLRKHFYGGDVPLVSLAFAYNRTYGYFNFENKFEDVELTKGFIASADNTGQLEWDVRSLGVNMIVSHAFGKWTPFAGAGVNRMYGSVRGRLESIWRTPLISPVRGEASSQPEPSNTRLIAGFQRSGSFFQFFVNGEMKASGANAGRAYIVSSGLAAPFRIGAASTIVRQGRNRKKRLVDASRKRRRMPVVSAGDREAESSIESAPRRRSRAKRVRIKRRRKRQARWGRQKHPELIFIR